MGPRYHVAEVEVGDSNTNVDRDTTLQIGRLNLRLMLERDTGEGYATLGLARVVERRADNRLVLDNQYIPPMLHAQAHPVLAATSASCTGCCTSAAKRWPRGSRSPAAAASPRSPTSCCSQR